MTDDTYSPDSAKDRFEDHQQAVEACQHAADALSNGDLSYGSLLDEAARAVERAQHDDTAQAYRKTAYD